MIHGGERGQPVDWKQCPINVQASGQPTAQKETKNQQTDREGRHEVEHGSLHYDACRQPAPPELLKLVRAKIVGQPYDQEALAAEVTRSVETATRAQADLGLDIVNDGEMSKPRFLGYITEVLGGVRVTAEPFGNPWKGSRENNSFPEYYAWEASLNLNPAGGAKRVICDGRLSYKGQRQVAADIATFKAALAKVNVRDAFLPAISPSNVEFWIRNEHYKSDEEYIFALADVLREEYKAITDAGLLLQIDDPRLVTQYVIDASMSLEDCRKWAELRVEALNRALRGIPEEQVRFHTCYSIDMGPRTNDMELKEHHRHHSQDPRRRLFVRRGESASRARMEGVGPCRSAAAQSFDPRRHHPFDGAGRAPGVGMRSHRALRGRGRTRTGDRRRRLRVRDFRRQHDDPSDHRLGQARCFGQGRATSQRAIVGLRRKSGVIKRNRSEDQPPTPGSRPYFLHILRTISTSLPPAMRPTTAEVILPPEIVPSTM